MTDVPAKDLKEGQKFSVDGIVFEVKSLKVSQIGKHGRSKCRIEAVNLATKEPTILIKPSDEEITLTE